jgi:hypothetical protein
MAFLFRNYVAKLHAPLFLFYAIQEHARALLR